MSAAASHKQLLPAVVAGGRRQTLKEAGAGGRAGLSPPSEKCGWRKMCPQGIETASRFVFHCVRFKQLCPNGCRKGGVYV